MRRFNDDESGATAVEYALMVVAIAAVIILAVFSLGRTTGDSLCDSAGSLASQGTVTQNGC